MKEGFNSNFLMALRGILVGQRWGQKQWQVGTFVYLSDGDELRMSKANGQDNPFVPTASRYTERVWGRLDEGTAAEAIPFPGGEKSNDPEIDRPMDTFTTPGLDHQLEIAQGMWEYWQTRCEAAEALVKEIP